MRVCASSHSEAWMVRARRYRRRRTRALGPDSSAMSLLRCAVCSNARDLVAEPHVDVSQWEIDYWADSSFEVELTQTRVCVSVCKAT